MVADLDDGFVRTARAIQQAKCKLRMAGREFCVLEAVISCTFGWNKKQDCVTNTYLAEMCDMDPADVSKALTELARRQIITLEKRGYMKLVGVNKVVSEWKKTRETKTRSELSNSAKSLGKNTKKVGCFDLSEQAKTPNTKDSLTKDNIKPSSSKNADALPDAVVTESVSLAITPPRPESAVHTPNGKFWGTADDLTCAEYIHSKVLVVNPTAKTPNWAQWANDIRLMREQDGRTHHDICALFKWANRDAFWSANVLCPKTLRKQWDKLHAKRLHPAVGKTGARQAEPPMPRAFGEERPVSNPASTAEGVRPKLFGE